LRGHLLQPLQQVFHDRQFVRAGTFKRRVINDFGHLHTPGQRARMVDQEAPHEVRREPEERLPVVLSIAAIVPPERSDFDQLQVQLIHQYGGLPAMPGSFAPHVRAGESAQFGIEQRD
jgi:hypothetical protein